VEALSRPSLVVVDEVHAGACPAPTARQGGSSRPIERKGARKWIWSSRTDDRIYGVEIKSGRTVEAQETRGLESLGEMAGKGKALHQAGGLHGQTGSAFPPRPKAWALAGGAGAVPWTARRGTRVGL